MSAALLQCVSAEAAEVDIEAIGRPRVLIVRACRAPQLALAVQLARSRHPHAEIAVLSHRGHADTIRAAGADRVIELPGRRFGLLRLSPWTLVRLRAEQFTEVLIPQMTHHPEIHSNIYRVVAAIHAPRVVVIPGDEPPREITAERFTADTVRHSVMGLLAGWDAHVFLALLVAACCARRRAVPAADGRRRRVLHIISSLGVGGAQVQLAELLNRTPASEFDVELLVLGESDGDFSRQWLRRADVSITYVRNWPRLAPSVREITERCRAGNYDIVHTWLFMANMVGAAAARLAGVPLVIGSVRNLSIWKRERWYRQWWHRVGDALGSRAADVVTVNARALVGDHARWAWLPQRRIRVIHNGLDPARVSGDRTAARAILMQASGAPAGAVLVGTVGRLAHEKDQATFLRVLAGVRAIRADVHGIVIGDGELRGRLEAQADALGLRGAVTFLGRRSDARSLVAGFDLFVLTSRSEGFPNVLLEASLLDVPCVATNIAGNPDVLDDDRSLFPAGDVDAGIARVLDVLADPRGAAARAAAVHRRALELFTAEKSVATWLRLYRDLLAG